MTREEIGSILKNLRLKTGKTQKEVAEMLGRRQQIIGHWETGYSQPDANTLFMLCELYNTSVDEAFGFNKNANTGINYDELKLLEKYNYLNKLGKCEAVKRVEELTYIDKYTTSNVYEINEKPPTEKQVIQVPARGSSNGHFDIEMDEDMEKGFEEDLNYDDSNDTDLY